MSAAAPSLRDRLRSLPWNRFWAGVVAGAAALIVTFGLRLAGLGLFLPEVALDFVVTHIPGPLESFFIDSLGEGAKGLGFVIALVSTLAAFGLGALPFRRVQSFLPKRWAVIALYTVVTTAILLVLVLPLLGGGFLGSETAAGVGFAAFSQLVGSWIYAAVLDYFLVDVAARHPEGFSPSRRQFFIGAAGAVGALALAYAGFSATVVQPARLFFASVADMVAKEVTPNDEFYVVTKNLIDPTVDPASWTLTVDGLVATPLSLSYSGLQQRISSGALPAAEEYATMECVSNEVGGDLIGTAKWDGVRLRDLLQAAGLEAAVDWVEFTCADGYTVAVPLAKAMDPATFLVLQMNGAPLESRHGGPARILVPGKYGMFSAKWLTRVTAIQGEYLGFWQQKGWVNSAGSEGDVHTTAIIATPAPDAVTGRSLMIGGIALSAGRGISKVEVSTDGGASWQPATLRTPLDPELTWVLWTFPWTAPGGGAYRILARAYDASGSVQTAAAAPPFPNGASGYDGITLYVSG